LKVAQGIGETCPQFIGIHSPVMSKKTFFEESLSQKRRNGRNVIL